MSDLNMRMTTRPNETVRTYLAVSWVAWAAHHLDSKVAV
jgi:hypothetical protein